MVRAGPVFGEMEQVPRLSIRMLRQLMGNRMHPLTLEGLDKAMRELVR